MVQAKKHQKALHRRSQSVIAKKKAPTTTKVHGRAGWGGLDNIRWAYAFDTPEKKFYELLFLEYRRVPRGEIKNGKELQELLSTPLTIAWQRDLMQPEQYYMWLKGTHKGSATTSPSEAFTLKIRKQVVHLLKYITRRLDK